jgi:hypothetical protein
MRRNTMTRLVRLNEVQYAETEHQIAGLVAQGFVPVPLEVAEVKEDKPPKGGKGKKEVAAPPEGDEQH